MKLASPGAAALQRGEALAAAGRVVEALKEFQRAAREPESRYRALVRQGRALATLRRHEEALAVFDQAVALRPAEPLAHFRRSFSRLLFRDFAGGFEDYEHRLRSEEFSPEATWLTPALRARLDVLSGGAASLAGKRVLVLPEQGVGDQIMFSSALPDLAREARDVTCVCDGRLMGLMSASMPAIRFLSMSGGSVGLSEYDRLVAIASLGWLYRRDAADFPATPFLAPRPEQVQAWAERLGPADGRLRVGLSWRGGIQQTGSARRSLPLDALRPLLDLHGCEFVSLQYGDPAAEVTAVNLGRERPIRLFDPGEIDDFESLAALTLNLDVVVSVQTTLVHLCGGLGAECHVLTPYNPEWRYCLEGDTLPWYGSVRLHRQPAPGDWSLPIARVAEVVRSRRAA